MENKGSIIAAAIIVVIVLSVVFGTIYYLASTFNVNLNPFTRFTSQTVTPKPSASSSEPGSNGTPSQTPGSTDTQAQPSPDKGGNQNSERVIYQGQGFKLEIPKNWGVLKCSNSENFELDPYNGESKTINCDRAQKPVTILVNSSFSCSGGEVVKIANLSVRRTKTQYRDWLTNQWCFEVQGKTFNITHRVSDSGNPATSKDDFSFDIEKIISSISF